MNKTKAQQDYKLGTNFRVERLNGKFPPESKERFREQLNSLNPSAWFSIQIKQVKGGYERPTRYKYYFSALLPSIFDKMRNIYILDGGHPNTVEELHHCFKAEFNSVSIVNTETGERRTTTQSTRNLSDSEFINLYQESIMEIAINKYGCEPKFYEDWKEEMRIKHEGKN